MMSQDGFLAFINIATYGQEYLNFLSGGEPSDCDDGFMTMIEYGPFDLRLWKGPAGDGLGMFLQYAGALMQSGLDS